MQGGRLTEADTQTTRLGATPSGLSSAHLHNPPCLLQAGCPSCRPTNSVKALKATSAFGLGRRRYSSPQRCYLHHLCTSTYLPICTYHEFLQCLCNNWSFQTLGSFVSFVHCDSFILPLLSLSSFKFATMNKSLVTK